MKKELAKLLKIEDLREVWDKEPDFTEWLSEQENLDLLGEEIEISMKLIKTEASVGKFRVDILAEEEISGRKIVIENQLEGTNHDHLGKIITYASGYDAKVVIWVVRDIREEHRRGIEWLNEHTDEETGFFLVKVELLQIEDSNLAPHFNIVVRPNERAKMTKASGNNPDYLLFWEDCEDFIKGKTYQIRLQRPSSKNWRNLYMEHSSAHIAHILLAFDTKGDSVSCGLYIQDKSLFSCFTQRKEEICKTIGEDCDWKENPNSLRVDIRKKVPDLFSEKGKESIFPWFYEKALLFKKVFEKFEKP